MSLSTDPNDVCLCPLYTPAFEYFDIQWFTREVETPEVPTRCCICCHRPAGEGYRINGLRARPILHPFVFELIGQIAEHDCHLTADGYGDRTEAPVASCWIEPCPGDRVARIEWAQGAGTIHRILDTIRIPWTADVLASEGNPLRLQLFFEPPEGDSLQEHLPLYERNGHRHVPTSLSEVPFRCAMRFLFTIRYSHNLAITGGPRMVYAEIFSARCL
ncbi:hypothetical protein LXA43DRAFT_958506 [Ganoderma leucocontextum]|nr:hypothetical protein LXA43DRAFT_958506 [Ganoderma leucocontextum]